MIKLIPGLDEEDTFEKMVLKSLGTLDAIGSKAISILPDSNRLKIMVFFVSLYLILKTDISIFIHK